MASAWGQSSSSSPFRSCDALIRRLEQNDPTLTDVVILPTKQFGAAEAKRLCVTLEQNANSHWRSLSASGHSLPAASLGRLGKAISESFCLKSLSVGDKNMGDEGVIALCEGLSTGKHSLEVLDLSYKGIGSSGFHAIFRTLGRMNGLKHVNLSRNHGIGDAELLLPAGGGSPDELTVFKGVEELDFSDCQITSRFATHFFPMLTSMKTLRLSKNQLGAEGVLPLQGAVASVSSLHFSDCALGDDGIQSLVSILSATGSSVSLLDLSNNNITALGIAKLCECLQPAGEDDNTEATKLGNLQELNLSKNSLGEEGIEILIQQGLMKRDGKGLPSLKILDLSATNCGITGAILAAKQNCLESLCLFNNNLNSEGFQGLASSIPDILSGNMAVLDLSGNNANKAAVVELLDSVYRYEKQGGPSRLKTLILGGNEGGLEVEESIGRLKSIRPDIDVARDKPARR